MLTVALTATALASAAQAPAHADANATPSYEVKLNLGTSALTSGAPSAAVRSAFGLSSTRTKRSYEYFDTSGLALDQQGWSVRLRHKDGKDFEETFKKRYAVSGGNIDAALTQANGEGFDSSDTNYDAEVDWGYSKQTLSFSNEKGHSDSGYSGTSMPSEATGRGWLVAEIPGKLDDWGSGGWGGDTLSASRAHGPVTSTVWKGTWKGVETEVEVLPIKNASGTGTENVVELSFKTDDYSTASSLRGQAISTSDAPGWLLHTDILKTNLILNRY
ncbi:hypothetical protein VV02_07315 [Luteipulveratus mongoliensis]|uniref:CYTH domain-containing protein n=1 Tax=Luteipulveratus mongoliensis TaxID=571913 RepID=A0A0K1JPU1_9MICO|nr:hypothetical protein VV02_07315 [Luteipulveratus mongoliensis]